MKTGNHMSNHCEICPSCNHLKRSAAVSKDGLCDECGGRMTRARRISTLPDRDLNEMLNDPAGLDRLLADVLAPEAHGEAEDGENVQDLPGERWDGLS
jgi:hypothetical protein